MITATERMAAWEVLAGGLHDLTRDDLMAAYGATAERFSLRHQQRSALDVSPLYLAVMLHAHLGHWNTVEHLLIIAGVKA